MEWLEELDDTERKSILAATSHATIDFDFHLSDSEFAVADRIFSDLDKVQNGGIPDGYATRIPGDVQRALWAATCAFAADIHAPLDNLPPEDWDLLDSLHETLNLWSERPTSRPPSP